MIRLLFFVGAMLMPFFLLAQDREYVLGDTVWMKDLSEKGYNEYSTHINGQEYGKQLHAYIYQESECFMEQFPQENNWFAYHHLQVKQRFEDQWGTDTSIYSEVNRKKLEDNFRSRFTSQSYPMAQLYNQLSTKMENFRQKHVAISYALMHHQTLMKTFPVCHPNHSGAFHVGHIYQMIDLDSSLFWFKKAEIWSKNEIGDFSFHRGNALFEIGNNLFGMGKFDSAFSIYSKSLNVFLYNSDENSEYIQYVYDKKIMLAYERMSFSEDSLEKMFNQYVEIIKSIKYKNKIMYFLYASRYYLKGNYHMYKNNLNKALECYSSAFAIIKEGVLNNGMKDHGNTSALLFCLFEGLKAVNILKGNDEVAFQYYRIALSHLKNNHYDNYLLGSQFFEYYEYLKKQWDIDGSQIALQDYLEMYNLYKNMNENNDIWARKAKLNYALCHIKLNNELGILSKRDSLIEVIKNGINDNESCNSALYSKILANTYKYDMDFDNNLLSRIAIHYDTTARVDRSNIAIISIYYNLIFIFNHNIDSALYFAERALKKIPINFTNGLHRENVLYLQTLLRKAELLRRLPASDPRRQQADSCLILAEQAADRALANLKNMNDRLEFVGTLKQLVEIRLPILLERRDTLQALELVERNRARTLHLNQVEAQLQHLNQIPPEDRQALDSLNTALTPIDIELSLLRAKTKPTPEEQKRMEVLTHQKISCEEKRLDVLQKIETNIPEYTEKLHEKPLFSVSGFRKDFFNLPENQNTVCLSYFQAKDSLYAFVLSPKKITLKILPVSDSLVNAKVAYLNAWMVDSVILQQKTKKSTLARKNFEAYVPLASELYQQLIAPIADELKGKSVVILPDDALWQLPFEALLTESMSLDSAQKLYVHMEESAYQSLPYWLKNGTISRRLSLYAYKKPKITAYDYDLVAFAPVFEPKQATSVNNSLQIRTFLRGVERWATRSTITADGRTLQPLYETVKEVKNISKNMNGKIQVRLKNDATELSLKSFSDKRVRYFHIATHGFANLKQTHLSGLFFYPEKNEDGALYSGEVSQMNFPCYLLTLSACETGKGKMVSGEGMVGLMYNFFKSGTENIVSSLWAVNDYSTAQLMEQFYKRLKENNTPQQSLIDAKKTIIKSNNAHPYFWSAFNAYQW